LALARYVQFRPLHVVAIFAALAMLGMVLAAQALAYNGEFCYGYYLDKSNNYGCTSSYVTHVRRAVSHDAGHGYNGIYPGTGPAYITNTCYSNGCTNDTGYYCEDVNGYGQYQEYAGGLKAGYGYGYLYP
jgi:hypothetical protein